MIQLDDRWKKEGHLWAFSAKTYIENVIEKVKELFEGPFKVYKTPLEHEYHPEIDEMPFLSPEWASKYQSLTGSANWAITLGRF